MENHQDRTALFEGPLMDLLHDPGLLSGAAIRGQIFWFSGDATLARASCINWSKGEFICCPVINILDSFAPRHQQSIIIDGVELLAISIAVRGAPGEGIVRIVVTDNVNALSRTHRLQ